MRELLVRPRARVRRLGQLAHKQLFFCMAQWSNAMWWPHAAPWSPEGVASEANYFAGKLLRGRQVTDAFFWGYVGCFSGGHDYGDDGKVSRCTFG